MSPVVEAFLCSWPFDPGLLLALTVTAAVYLRGWFVLHRRDPVRWHAGRLSSFLGGLTSIYLALASPIEPFSALLLQVHMVQHLLLMMAAPPLLWLGAPLFPLLRGLPMSIRVDGIGPFLRWPALRHAFERLTHPVAAWLLYVGATWLWHVPALYEVALRSSGWHYVQHLCFLATGLLFWYPVVRPYPSRPRWSTWLLFPFLFLADVQNTVLAALLTFSDQVLYPYYAQVPRLDGGSALDDQATAGALMWVPGSLAFLVPLFGIALARLYGRETGANLFRKREGEAPAEPFSPRLCGSAGASPSQTPPCEAALPMPGRIALPLVTDRRTPPPRPWDLLHMRGIGRFLRWRHARLSLQVPLLLLAIVIIYDGLTSPAVAPLNLAGVLPWIHWRGLVVFGLLGAGNVFCGACPFLLPRTLARRFLPKGRAWPRWLRHKWLAVVLLVLFLWAYEAFALWDSPWWTAWLAVGYFVGALLVDGLFRGASFCKYVCPIGQFNFVQSLISPLQVTVRDAAVCADCKTKDCIRGRPATPTVRGCELHLFQPRKAGNMDCTFCLDCVHACPHDNVGITAVPPAAALWHDRLRSGIGRFGKRRDLAALVLVLVFGAFANAAGMTAPVLDWQERLRIGCGLASPFWIVSVSYLGALVLVPVLAVGGAAALSRRWGRLPGSWLDLANRFAYVLVPLGFAMWLAHYSFHFVTSYDAAIPALQRFAADLGSPGTVTEACSCCRPVADWLPRLEILFLDFGLLLSLYTAYRTARDVAPTTPRAVKTVAPWAVLLLLLFVVGTWIVLQPMQMRGTLSLGTG